MGNGKGGVSVCQRAGLTCRWDHLVSTRKLGVDVYGKISHQTTIVVDGPGNLASTTGKPTVDGWVPARGSRNFVLVTYRRGYSLVNCCMLSN